MNNKQAFIIADWLAQLWYQLGKISIEELPKRRELIMGSLLNED